uniref:Scavenger receptor cysteine-rich type 1 protein M130-like isoform X1 n=1 Tax=Crassostrea virginica TaxID=6565 RepID=A0A8B8AST7_CRAVI|nr:scavenger receptor cysteine-rich type 1 protein M130-like isoform X1 [Crassostrea virginica]XP_022294246.1 scavenger receptor cysteine-rich type 1 protein M130-like isoform X2 [Crassostrea virginica]
MLLHATETLFVLMLCTFVKTTDICLQASWDNYTDGKKLPEFSIKIIEKIGLQSCYRECQAHGNCFSVNFNRKEFMCQLINEKASHLKPLFDDENFVYMEITDTVSAGGKTCGNEVCNNYSTCIRFSSQKMKCIATDCAEPYPLLDNGFISERTYDPISATYSCNSGFTSIGSGNTITCRPGGKWSTLSYVCKDHAIRLGNSSVSNEGLLYVYLNGEWGTVCDDGFGMVEANVSCRTLGFQRAVSFHGGAMLGTGSGGILMDDVRCSGYEESLFNCNYTADHNCGHHEDVGVICE